MTASPLPSLRLSLLLVATCFMAVACLLPAQKPAESHQAVIIKQMHFEPATLNVKAGDTIEWKNQDIFTHTVTANDGSFDSGSIAPGHSWQTTISDTGNVAYHCGPHPNMKAELVVGRPGEREQHEHDAALSQQGQPSLGWSPPNRPYEIHPILVNFTAALLPLALLSDLLGRLLQRQALNAAGFWMMVYEAIITPLTAIAGWWWKSTDADQIPAKLIAVHQWLGTAAVLLFILLAVWRGRLHRRGTTPSWAYLLSTLVAVLALIYQGSLGGTMVFGH